MTFAAQWANRHDGECEAAKAEAKAREIVKAGWNLTHNWMELPATANDLIREVSRALGCACYRRWLEARLTELEKQDEIHWKTRRTLLTEKESLEARLEVCQRLYEELGQQIDERVRRRVREAILALPPKGAGDE